MPLAEETGAEPILLYAAPCTNLHSSERDQRRDKVKASFSKGLWHLNFQLFWFVRRRLYVALITRKNIDEIVFDITVPSPEILA